MEKKTFKFNQEVYIAYVGGFMTFKLLKGRIVSIRKYQCAVSDFMYGVETCYGIFEALPDEIYASVEEFKNGVQDCVVA